MNNYALLTARDLFLLKMAQYGFVRNKIFVKKSKQIKYDPNEKLPHFVILSKKLSNA